MINQVLNPMHAQPNCKVPVFRMYGFMCSLTNVIYVFDQRFGYLPLDEALKHGEIEQL